jgi:hypothetical protein
VVQEFGLWETVGMAEKKTPKPKATSLNKRTPDRAAHTEAKKRKQQAKRTRQIFDDNVIDDLEGRSKDDLSQPGPSKRNRRNETTALEIPISNLVPSEPRLDRSSIDKVKSLISSGTIVQRPRVVRIRDAYYVRDGNHRVMAMKELGHENIECSVQYHRPSPGVSDFDTDDFDEAISLGYKGFNNLSIGSAKDKEEGYEEEDDLLSMMDSRQIQVPGRRPRKRTASQRCASGKRRDSTPD